MPKGYKKETTMGLKMAKHSVYPQMAKPKDCQTVTMMASLLRVKHWAMLMARNLENLMDSPMAKTMAFLPMAKRMDYDLVNQMANCWVIHLANWKDSPMGM